MRNELHKRQRPIVVKNITQWLKEIIKELKANDIADKIIIYWDEFTSVMDTSNTSIFNLIQRIAELSEDYGIYIYLISHRTQRQGMTKDERKHILGRFIDINYQMSDITTYHLMAGYILKKDLQTWQLLRNKKNDSIEKLISKISQFETAEVKENVRDLFPIHPFTAYISHLIAREIGSTERSIFLFLNDEKMGFRYFLNNNPANGSIFLTADYIFDFFMKDFEEEDNQFLSTVLSRFKYDSLKIKDENINYLPIFKGLLLLNIAHRIINVGTESNELVIPKAENLKLMFLGTKIQSQIDNLLNYLHENKLIFKDYQNRYIIESSSLPIPEINEKKRILEKNYDRIEKIIDNEVQKNLFSNWMNSHRRKDVTEITLMDGECYEHDIHRKTRKFKKSYSLKIISFIARDHSALINIEGTIKKLDPSHSRNYIFVVLENIFTSEDIGQFIEFRARAEVAQKRHLSEDEIKNLKNSENIIEQWIENVKDTGYISWFLYNDENILLSDKCRFKDFHNELNDRISKIIFKNSFDILYPRMGVITAWQEQLAKKTAEIFLCSNNQQELINLTKRNPMNVTQSIIKDRDGTFIVNERLKIVNSDPAHPLIKMIEKVGNKFKSSEEFNLVDAFAFLFEPPFGFYKCHVFLAAAGFILRKYRGKLYNVSTGEVCSDSVLKEMLEKVFQFHCDNAVNAKKDLFVRLGSENEKKLVKLIQEIFSLTHCHSLIDTRLHLHEWVKTNLGFPLWLFNYSDIDNEDVLISLDTIHNKILDIKAENHKLNSNEIKNIYDELNAVRYDLSNIVDPENEEYKKILYLSFFESIENFHFEEDNFVEIMQYLEENMNEDQVFWDEIKIKSILKDWYIEKLKRKQIPDIDTDDVSEEESENKKPRPVEEDLIIRVKERVNSFRGDYKNLLYKLIEKRPDISRELEKLLDSWEE